MQISRRNLLAAGVAAGLTGRAAAAPPPRRLVLVIAHGGWDTTYALDPKPDNPLVDIPAGQQATYGSLDIWLADTAPSVATFFDNWSDRCAVVRGIQLGAIDHTDCLRKMLTGTRDRFAPDLGALTGHALGSSRPIPYLMLGDRGFSGPLAASVGRVGANAQLRRLTDPALAHPPPAGVLDHQFHPDFLDSAAIERYLAATTARLRPGRTAADALRLDEADTARSRAAILRSKSWLANVGDLFTLAGQAEVAAAALAEDLAWAVSIEAGVDFDTHALNNQQGELHDTLFAGLDALATALDSSGLLADTVVAVISEMTRTPLLNGLQGKDHWPHATALLFGAGIAPGAYGGTDDQLGGVAVDLATGRADPAGVSLLPEHFAAGLLAHVGVAAADGLGEVPTLGGFGSS